MSCKSSRVITSKLLIEEKWLFRERCHGSCKCNLEGSDFTLEHAWRMLKDKPKLLAHFIEKCSKEQSFLLPTNTHHRQIQIHQLKFMKLTHHHESLIQWDLSDIEQAIRGKMLSLLE